VRANDCDLRREPTQVRFNRDWSYVASYRHGQCTSDGHWFATIDEARAISFESHCDDRPGSGTIQLTVEWIDDRRILVNHDLYLPEGTSLSRGILWSLLGFKETVIRIEYDMPIRAGVPTQFTVTITNASESVLQLERFSLTDNYNHYGRSVGDPGKPLVLTQEIAGQDLHRVELAPGESHVFPLDVTFPLPGPKSIYLNTLISGTTQNWDTHQSVEMTIRE
jgi:hypothetical protein